MCREILLAVNLRDIATQEEGANLAQLKHVTTILRRGLEHLVQFSPSL